MKKLIAATLGVVYLAVLLLGLILLFKPGAAVFYKKFPVEPGAVRRQDGLYALHLDVNTRFYNPDTLLLFENSAALDPVAQNILLEGGQTGIFALTEIGSRFIDLSYIPRDPAANHTILIRPRLLNSRTGGIITQILLLGIIAFLAAALRNPEKRAALLGSPLGVFRLWLALFDRPRNPARAAAQQRWLQAAADILWVVYLYALMEWIFMVTRPSFMDLLGFWPKVKILLLAALPAALVGLLSLLIFALLHRLLAPALPWFGRYSRHIPAAFLAACLALILFDNFTYTVLRFGIVTSRGLVRVTYGIGFVLLFLYILKKFAAARNNFRIRLLAASLLSLSLLLAAFAYQSPAAQRAAQSQSGAASARPNIILLSSDGLNAENLSLYGYERDTTPFLRELAATSLVGQNHFTNAAHSMGSDTALLTGKSPFTTRVLYPPDTLKGSDKYEHLPGLLQLQGYRSVQLGVDHYVDARQIDFQNAFSEVNCRNIEAASLLEGLKGRGYGDAIYLLDDIVSRMQTRLAHIFFIQDMVNPLTQVTQPAFSTTTDADRLDCLENYLAEAAAGSQPLFAHVHLMETHGGYFYPPERVFSAGKEQTEYWMRDFYDDAILNFDRQVRSLVDVLVKNGQYEHTVLVIYSDHAQGYLTQKRIPLLIHFPGGDFAGQLTANTQNLDLAPTLLDYLGLPVPDWMEGSSLLQPVDPARIILAGGTRKASRQDNNLFSLSAASVKPPFYQFSYLTAVQCSRWHSINLDQLNMKSDWVSSAVDPCPGSQPAAPEQIREQVGGWLRDRGYDLPAGW